MLVPYFYLSILPTIWTDSLFFSLTIHPTSPSPLLLILLLFHPSLHPSFSFSFTARWAREAGWSATVPSIPPSILSLSFFLYFLSLSILHFFLLLILNGSVGSGGRSGRQRPSRQRVGNGSIPPSIPPSILSIHPSFSLSFSLSFFLSFSLSFSLSFFLYFLLLCDR